MIVGLTSGVFDLIHVGHLHYLERCKAQCDKLIVGVDSDTMVRMIKGAKRPFVPEHERFDLVNSLRWVDTVVMLYNVKDLEDISRRFRVNKVFKHEGFKNQYAKIWGLNDGGAELIIIPDVPGLVSTTQLVRRIQENKDSWGRGS